MDALRLLSCSTGLKLKSPREVDAKTTLSAQGTLLSSRGSFLIPGRKRKLSVDDVPDVTSSQGQGKLNRNDTHDDGEEAARRNGINADIRNALLVEISEEERRRIFKSNQIKITDLRALHSSDLTASKKAHKEAARIFPRPLIGFNDLDTHYQVNKALAENIFEQGYVEPTEVQIASIPLLLAGDGAGPGSEPDLLTIAPTGSGKTLAFLVPLIQKISRAHRKGQNDTDERHVRAIIVAPTKELVGQTVNEGRKLAARTGVSITEMRKGMRLHGDHATAGREDETEDDEYESDGEEQEKEKENMATVVKTDIIVTTPLLLVNAIATSKSTSDAPITQSLPRITNLIFDEADVLLDPLFRSQTISIWSACTSPELRVSLWSATMGSNIESLALDTIQSRQHNLHSTQAAEHPRIRVVVGLKDSALPPTITHKLTYAATEPGKLLGLRQLIHPPPSLGKPKVKSSATKDDVLPPLRPPFLVFTQTIDRATALHKELLYDLPTPTAGQPRIAVLHSSLSSSVRAETMTRFRKGSIWVLITTDLLSRGVDFRGVNVVVNYDIPNTAASYVHRAGRTGRAGREGGVCVTFYTKEDVRYVKNIANVIAASHKGQQKNKSASDGQTGNDIPPWLLQALPQVSRKDRADLKQHGVDVRRAIREGEEKDVKRKKLKARIGTVSGYDRRKEERRRGAIEGSKRRKAKQMATNESAGDDVDEWGGIDD